MTWLTALCWLALGLILGRDSLDTVEIVMGLEEEFGIEIPDEDCDALRTVGDLIAYVERRQAE